MAIHSKVIAPFVSMTDLAHVLSHDAKVPVSRPYITAMIRRDQLPKPVQIGRVKGWYKQDIERNGNATVEQINNILSYLYN